MVNYFIYAKDFSGSTKGCSHYHRNAVKTIDQFKSDVEKIKNELLVADEPPTESKIIYLHWGDMCYEVDEETAIKTYIELEGGNMYTKPGTIIEWIQENYNICDENNEIKLLYIITDGLIYGYDSHICFELNEHMEYKSVVFHAFNENLNEIDLSVAASFFKSRCMSYRNYELFDNVNISEEYNYDKINGDNFEVEKEELKSYIKLKFIKNVKNDTMALQEIDKLKNLRDRLFAELSLKLPKSKIKLETKDRNQFLSDFVNTDWYKNLNTPVNDAKVEIEKSISTLINYIVSNKKSYSFDALKFDLKFDSTVEKEPIVDVNFEPEQEIEFPDIILDDDKGIPVIILTELDLLNKIIFDRKTWNSAEVSPASFSKFKSSMDCPLFLLNDSDISQSIGYFYTLNVYKQLLANTTRTEPRTRKPFHGGLVLTDTDQFDKYNDFILAATYFNSKKVYYNIGLFYYVLWKNCENKEWMDKNVVEQFKKYVMRRISTTVCKIGLSSLPLDPQQHTSLPTALWYCVELSSCIFKNDLQHYNHERLRMYYSVAHCMIEILKYFNYDLDLESIEKRKDLIRHVMILKKIQKHEEKVYYLLEKIFKKDHDFLISEIEKPYNLYKLNYLKLNHKGILCDNIIEEKIHINDYIHLLHFEGDLEKSKAGKGTFEICKKTFRPFFTIDKNKSFYTELINATKKVVINNDDDKDKINITFEAIDSIEFDKILSLYNLFINCVKDLGKYPTLSEYVMFISKKKKFNGDLVTIFPSNVYFDATAIYSQYENVMANVDVNEFIEVSKKYYNRVERIKAEEIVKFNNDNDIIKFICNEESKACLQKKNILN